MKSENTIFDRINKCLPTGLYQHHHLQTLSCAISEADLDVPLIATIIQT